MVSTNTLTMQEGTFHVKCCILGLKNGENDIRNSDKIIMYICHKCI